MVNVFFFVANSLAIIDHLITGGSHHVHTGIYWNAVDMWMVAKTPAPVGTWIKSPLYSAIIVSAFHNFLTKWCRISSIHNALYVAYTKHPSILS